MAKLSNMSVDGYNNKRNWYLSSSEKNTISTIQSFRTNRGFSSQRYENRKFLSRWWWLDKSRLVRNECNVKNWPSVSPSLRSSSELCSEISECVCRWESTYKCSPDKTHDDNSMLLAEGNWQAANGSHAAKPTSIEPHQTVIILSMRIVNVSPILRGFRSV